MDVYVQEAIHLIFNWPHVQSTIYPTANELLASHVLLAPCTILSVCLSFVICDNGCCWPLLSHLSYFFCSSGVQQSPVPSDSYLKVQTLCNKLSLGRSGLDQVHTPLCHLPSLLTGCSFWPLTCTALFSQIDSHGSIKMAAQAGEDPVFCKGGPNTRKFDPTP